MKHNILVESNTVTNLGKIYMNSSKNFYKNSYEKEILDHERKDLYKVMSVSGPGYNGYIVAIYDSKRVSLAVSRKLGNEGENALDIAKREHARIVINAGGFYDPGWSSSGGIPHGIVIHNHRFISQYGTSNVGGGFVGFTDDGKLYLGNVSLDDVLNLSLKDAIQFGPYLIVNGKKTKVYGNGGWGIAPRTAIGQRRDGVVLFLVINGRIPSSIGASMRDLIDIMDRYGAYNAVNMDGGSSSALVINNKIINRPVGGGDNGLRKLPTFWIVK